MFAIWFSGVIISASATVTCNPYFVYFVKENTGFFASLET